MCKQKQNVFTIVIVNSKRRYILVRVWVCVRKNNITNTDKKKLYIVIWLITNN